jgi:integrase
MARQLREVGFCQMRAPSLKGKHVDVLLQRWKAEGLSAGTLKNRLAHLRWWAEKVGKAGILPADNTRLDIPERRYVSSENKAETLGDGLDRITDAHVHMSLRLQVAFGLRREESIKFHADRGDHIAIKGTWAKGGRARTIPITTPEQRAVLDEVKSLAGAGSLIPADKNYIRQRQVYDGQCKKAGLSRMHGLRHRYT